MMKLCFEHVMVQILLTLLHACGILLLINLTEIPDYFKYTFCNVNAYHGK